ncbi:MAG: NADH-quinone oxidoreductase subunit C [Deltaproteobacteria bacterium]|nr:NADH-quinone oxidoreductase subunit C [Deltaproteobacteria bacterium]
MKRPRGGLYAAVRSVPVWLRSLARGGQAFRARALTAVEPQAMPPAVPFDLDALRAGLAERGATLRCEAGGPTLDDPNPTGDGSAPLAFPGVDGTPIAELSAAAAGALLRWLRDDPALGFDVLDDLTVVDRLPEAPRFDVVYCLRASASGARLRVRARIEVEPPELDSVASLWRSADWLEREVKDMFGVRFRGHPGLLPILLSPDFAGAPLRRDFAAAAGEPAGDPPGNPPGKAGEGDRS